MSLAFMSACARVRRRVRSAASIGRALPVIARRADRSGSFARRIDDAPNSGKIAPAASNSRLLIIGDTASHSFHKDAVTHFAEVPPYRSEEHTSELQSLMRIS